MYLFIDESGVHLTSNKSVVSVVYVEVENLEKINTAIIKIEKKLKISSFHWSKQKWSIREEFITSILKEKFSVKVVIIKNPFTKKVLLKSLQTLITERKIKTIVLDGKKPKWYSLQIKKILRDSGISVNKVITGNDQNFPCLRLADAFAGLVRTYWRDKNNQ